MALIGFGCGCVASDAAGKRSVPLRGGVWIEIAKVG
jgi:hypothetical protein